jgi:anti-sigma factor RsiW
VHAAKLGTDISAGVVCDWLMWHRRVPAALLAGFVPAAIASALVTRCDLSTLADTRRGVT